MKSLDSQHSAPPTISETSDPLILHSLLDGMDQVGIDRRGTFQALELTLWSQHVGMSTGSPATLVGTRPGNVLVVLCEFAMNQGDKLAVHRQLPLEAPSRRTPCHVLSSRPGMRAGDAGRTYVLELQRARAA